MADEIAVAAAIKDAIEHGPLLAMRSGELRKGYRLIRTGSVEWLPDCDWVDDMVVSQVGQEIRIVAIKAKDPGNGAFSRLIVGIAKAGLRPVVLCPLDQMEEILRRWRWSLKIVGSNFDDREEQWRPRPGWLKQRIQQCR